MIKTENLSMVFTTEEVQTKALNEVNIEVKQGEFVAIMGPSGCGKSTLLNILGTLDSPTSGKYFFNGKEIDKMGESQLTAFRKGNIGFVFQSFNLIDELTVFENVELPLVYLGCRKSERKRKVMEVLDRMNIAHRAGHFPQQLSGGQQQRVAIARAVVTDCPLILADEPTGNLDSTNGAEVMELLRELNGQGTTIVMVTHSERDASFARRLSIFWTAGSFPEYSSLKTFIIMIVTNYWNCAWRSLLKMKGFSVCQYSRSGDRHGGSPADPDLCGFRIQLRRYAQPAGSYLQG